ncbi:MAG TPA: DinB family protein [Pseudonocardiaceae bacterium]|nr:DinB family protein [Pseudonocardiaceae bacterium]
MTAQRLVPLVEQFDFTVGRLVDRMSGPDLDSGNGVRIPVSPMTDDEYLWEPVARCWTLRRRTEQPGPDATMLVGAGEWRRDGGPPPDRPPVTTIAWRLAHLAEMLAMRADHRTGTHSRTTDAYHHHGDAKGGITAFQDAAVEWRQVLVGMADDELDAVGVSTYPYGSDPEDPFIVTAWWVNQELLHHGAEIALLRDLYRER